MPGESGVPARRPLRAASAVPLLLLLPGCATLEPRGGFADVQTLVSQRQGGDLHWSQGSPEDAAVEARVAELLQGELDADAATQIALLKSPALQAGYEALGVSQADMVEAGMPSNPVFVGSVRPVVSGPSGTNLELELAHSLLQLPMLPARRRIARAQFEEAKLRVAHQVLAFSAEVRAAHTELQAASHVAQLLTTAAEADGASAEYARRLHEAGNLSDLELARQQSRHEDARIELLRAEAELTPLRERLARLMGLSGDESWSVPDELPALPGPLPAAAELERLALSRRLDLRAGAREIEALRQARSLARIYRWIPFAEVGVSSERDPEGGGVWVVGPSLSLEIPLFDWGQTNLARLEARLREAQQRLAGLELDARSRVREARAQLGVARALVERYRSAVVPLRERIVALSLQEYNFMLMGAFELLAAKQDEIDGYRGYVDALRDFWVAHAELRDAVGGDLPFAEGPPDPPPTPSGEPEAPPVRHHHH